MEFKNKFNIEMRYLSWDFNLKIKNWGYSYNIFNLDQKIPKFELKFQNERWYGINIFYLDILAENIK